ncbi:Leu/Phe/Val dehydrogenase [Pontibacterium sp.]|jgi:leucine dehydrogenase|uniref:Leu/Phe/Val dehydrogenase n=1 Tax=Pontibacterium sp. TaxID=2036026 RepID=UPI00356B392D
MFEQMENAGLERLHLACDPETGLRAIIAIHSTLRGPAIGGCRFITYQSEADAITDATRLARGMSYKAALAGLPHGGAKAVLIKPNHNFDRNALMESFGRFVQDLGGRYITAMDSGTLTSDMDSIAHTTKWVTCTSQIGDPSPYTAMGVFEGIKAAVKHLHGSDSLQGVHVALQGLGHVGYAVAQMLYNSGAHLTVSDIDQVKVLKAVNELGAKAVATDKIYGVEADVFCPCGLGAIINDHSLQQLRCRIVAGSANNQLEREEHGELLRRRNILYAPDYLINAGGLIFVAMQHAGQADAAIAAKVRQVGTSLSQLFQQADQEDRCTHRIANERAETIIARAALHSAA